MGIDNLYNLTPQEFERLCARLLESYGYTNIKLVGGANDQGVDIICEKDSLSIVVQVKHLRDISLHTIFNVLNKIKSSNYSFDQILLITSAPVNQKIRSRILEAFSDISVIILDQADISKKLLEKAEIDQKELKIANIRNIKQKTGFVIGIIGAFASIFSSILSGTFFVEPDKPQLYERIEKVELALVSIKNLEKYLDDIKQDMIKTEQESKAIEVEYQNAKKLEKLTKEQYEVISKAIGRKSAYQTIFDYSMGLLLGVAGSLIASVIYSRVKQNRLLKDNT